MKNFTENHSFSVFAFLVASLTFTGNAKATPPLAKSLFFDDDRVTTLSLGYLSSTIPLKRLSLSVESYDLERKCAEAALSQNFSNQGGAAYLSVLRCFEESAAGTLEGGSGQSVRVGYLFGRSISQIFVEFDGSKVKFDDAQAKYENTRAALSAGFFFSPFNRDESNFFVKNFSVGADYTYSLIREKRSEGGAITRSDDGRLVSEVAFLTEWSYAFSNESGFSLNGSFGSREELGARFYYSF